MYEIKIGTNSKIGLPTWMREVVSANILEVEAGTNGYHGGDAGHGSKTYIRIEDAGGTSIKVKPINDGYGNIGFEMELGGDCELSTIIEAFKFVVTVLEDQIEHQDI